jgi:hypothetical protein
MHDNKNFHWLYGIEELFNTQSKHHQKTLKHLIEAVLRGDINQLAILIPKLESLSVDEQAICLKVFTEYWNSNATNYELVHVLAILTADPFIISIDNWCQSSNTDINLNDHFGRGQFKSKLWLIDILSRAVINNRLGTVALYGGWYGTINWFLNEHFTVKETVNFEIDPECVTQSKLFNGMHNFDAIEINVADIICDDKKFNTVINTSCEHMDEIWFNNLPDGQFVALQTNDFFDCDQHTNCVSSLDEVIKKYPMQHIVYSGELATNKYNRFMLIGLK